MAKNRYGFISNRYRQPERYRKMFANWAGIYHSQDGTEYHIEAVAHYLAAEKEGANVEEYLILRQDTDCRRVIGRSKSQKGVIEILEKHLNK